VNSTRISQYTTQTKNDEIWHRKVFLIVRSYARPTKMHIEKNACSSECAWLARETCIYIICNHLKSWYEFPDSYTIYKHDLFIQIYVAAYAFGCVHTYIHINVCIWFFYQVCFVLKYLSSVGILRAGVPLLLKIFWVASEPLFQQQCWQEQARCSCGWRPSTRFQPSLKQLESALERSLLDLYFYCYENNKSVAFVCKLVNSHCTSLRSVVVIVI